MRGKSREAEERDERDKEILHLRLVEKWTFDRIAQEFGVSKQRIYQIVNDYRRE